MNVDGGEFAEPTMCTRIAALAIFSTVVLVVFPASAQKAESVRRA